MCVLALSTLLSPMSHATEFKDLKRLTVITNGLIPYNNVARLFALYVQDKTGMTVIVEPIAGVSGDLSMVRAIKEKDTVVLGHSGTFTLNPIINKTKENLKDQATIVPPLMSLPFALCTSKKINVHSMDELKAYYKTKGHLLYGSTGFGLDRFDNIVLLDYLNINDADVIKVQYRTHAEVLMTLVRGDVDYGIFPAIPLFLKSDGLDVLGFTGTAPATNYPDVPLLKEKMPDMYITTYGFFSVPDINKDLIPGFEKVVKEFMDDPKTQEYVKLQGFTILPSPSTISDANKFIKDEVSNKLIHTRNVKYTQ